MILEFFISLISGNKLGRSDQIKQMQGEVVYDTPIMLDYSNNNSLGVSFSRNEALQTSITQEKGSQVVDTPMMEAENYSKAYVSCSINETRSIVKTLELNGANSVDMPMMKSMNHNRMCWLWSLIFQIQRYLFSCVCSPSVLYTHSP